jgi:CDP-diacylglycerol--glycerol-3-phosphate 3-phosphatidyltransferase
VAFLIWGEENMWGTIIAAAIALALELTDILDGYFARKYNCVTDFGKLYDPFSDAFCRYTLFLGLYAIGVADLWMVLVIFYRDSSVSFLRSIAASRSVIIAARKSGKIKAIAQGVGMQIIFLTLILASLPLSKGWPLENLPWWTMLVITIITMGSFIDYLLGNLPMLRQAWSNDTAR